jgi:hypothetical protein
MVNVLILVLSARRSPWGELLECSQATWDAEDHPQTRTLYYCGKCDESHRGDEWEHREHDIGKVFYSPQYDEELERVSPRTMEAFEKSLELEWDFMARTHSSTYVHKRNLVEFCETLHLKNLLCGLMVGGDRPFMWGGGSFIMSRDVIEQFVASKERWNLNVMEDNGITELANELSIPLSGIGRMASIDEHPTRYVVTTYGTGEGFTFTDWSDINKAQPHFYFRCKQDLQRHKDLDIFRKLHQHYT